MTHQFVSTAANNFCGFCHQTFEGGRHDLKYKLPPAGRPCDDCGRDPGEVVNCYLASCRKYIEWQKSVKEVRKTNVPN